MARPESYHQPPGVSDGAMGVSWRSCGSGNFRRGRAFLWVKMEHATGRRLFWNALSGFGVGLGCTITTALFATGGGCSDRQLAGTLLVCSPLLATVPALLTSRPRLGPGMAATLTGVLAVLMGAVNAVVVWVVTQLLAGRHDFHDFGAVLIFSLPFGGIPGAGYAVPMAFGAWFARKKIAAPQAAVGAARGLLVTVAAVGAAASALVATTRGVEYSFWPVLLAFDVVVAAACVWVAIRDVRWAFRLRRMQNDPTGTFEIVPANPDAPSAGLRHLVGGAFGTQAPTPTHVVRLQTQETAPYRASRARMPVLSLEAPPTNVRRALLASAGILLVCAALLTYGATQMPQLAPRNPTACSPGPPLPTRHSF